MCENLKTVLIVGATRGIGLEFVKQFLRKRPAQIIATYRSLDTSGELQLLANQNSNLKLLKLDVNDEEYFEDFTNQIEQLTGDQGLQLYIHNAGILINDNFGNITCSNIFHAYETNAAAPILLTQYLLNSIRKSARRVSNTKAVYISSILGSIKNNDGNRYSHRMSKAALNMGVQTFARDFANERIEFVLLHPGLVKTEMANGEGEIDVQTSVNGMLKVLCSNEINRNFQMIGFDGEIIEW